MNIKKVDDKPMVIHTKEKAKLHIPAVKGIAVLFSSGFRPYPKGGLVGSHYRNSPLSVGD